MSTNDEWEKLLQKYESSNDPNLKRLYINGLAASSNKTLLKRYERLFIWIGILHCKCKNRPAH